MLDRLGQRQSCRSPRASFRSRSLMKAARLAYRTCPRSNRTGARRLPQGSFPAARAASCERFERARADRRAAGSWRCAGKLHRRPAPRRGADRRARCFTSARSKKRMPPYTRYGRPGVEQRVLEHPRLRVGAVEHGDLGQREALGRKSLDHLDDERGLVDGPTVRRDARAPASPLPSSSTGSCRAASGCS